jgi:hypothetical protein
MRVGIRDQTRLGRKLKIGLKGRQWDLVKKVVVDRVGDMGCRDTSGRWGGN